MTSGGAPSRSTSRSIEPRSDGAADAEQERHLGPDRLACGDPLAQSRSRASRGPARAAVPSDLARLGVEPGGERVAARQLRRRLAPLVRLAPLEQRVHGAPRAPSLLARRARSALAVALVAAARDESRRAAAETRAPAPCRSGRRTPRRRRSRCRRGGGWATVGGRRSTSGGGPSPSCRARRRPRGAVARQLGRALGRGQVDAHRDLRRLEARLEARPRLGRRHGDRRVGVARRPRGLDQPLDHRRAGLGLAARLGLDHAAEDQPLAGAGGGDVEEAQLLLGVALLGLLAELGVVVEVDRRGCRAGAAACPTRGGSLAAERQQRRPRRRPAGCATRSGTATTPNSSPLALWTVMIRTPSWPSAAVAAWASSSRLGAGGEEVEQAAQVAPLARLELARQPHQLADVGEARLARPAASAPRGRSRSRSPPRSISPASESRGAALAQARRASATKRAQQLAARRPGSAPAAPARRARPRRRRRPARPPARRGAARPPRARSSQSVSGATPQAGEARAPKQRLVVERVGDRRQQRADVGDLLLGPVAAAADHVGTQAGPLERVLVGVEVGEGAQQHDHLAARRRRRRPARAGARRRSAPRRGS